MRTTASLVLLLALLVGPARGQDADRLRAHVEHLASDALQGRNAGYPGNDRAADYLAGIFADLGLEAIGDDGTYLQAFEFPRRNDKGPSDESGPARTANVVGLLPGSDPELAREIVVLAAHFDHVGSADEADSGRGEPGDADRIWNGADDNASGTAVVLELARLYAARERRPQRSILFVGFSAEEHGLLGSLHYVEHPLLPLERHVAMINLDMVGKGVERLDVSGVGSSPRWLEGLARASAATGVGPASTREWYDRNSDHAPFLAGGVPAVHFFTGVHADYHRPTDHANRLDYRGMAAIARLADALLTEFADAPARPTFTRPPEHRSRPISMPGDLSGPFSYPLAPSDTFGFPGGPVARFDADGTIHVATGALVLHAGRPMAPLGGRLRSFVEPGVPVVRTSVDRGRATYAVEAFATRRAVWVVVTAANPGRRPLTAVVGADFAAEGVRIGEGRIETDRGVVATFAPRHDLSALEGPRLRFRMALEPGAEGRIVFRLPIDGTDDRPPVGLDDARRRAIDAWQGDAPWSIPEAKVDATLRASRARLRLAIGLPPGARAEVARAHDLLGEHAAARSILDDVLAGGGLAAAPEAVVAALGTHARLTADAAFARRVYPSVAALAAPLSTFDARDGALALARLGAPTDVERRARERDAADRDGPEVFRAASYQEGVGSDGKGLDVLSTFVVAGALLRAGRPRDALEDLYSILVHTSSTHAGLEGPAAPWGDRKSTPAPTGGVVFAARLVALLRSTLLAEHGTDLRLGPALGPAWTRPGRRLEVVGAPTAFGPVSFAIEFEDGGCRISFDPRWRTPPARVLFVVPWTVGEPDVVELPVAGGSRRIAWPAAEGPALSYDDAVGRYVRRYHLDFGDDDRTFLFDHPRPPRRDGPPIFIERTTVELVARDERATVHYTLDGRAPGPDDPIYREPLAIDRTTAIAVRSVWPDGRWSRTDVHRLERVEPRPAALSLEAGDELAAGVGYAYFETSLDRLPDFAALEAVRTGRAGRLSLADLEHAPDHFAVRFEGLLRVEADAVYAFYTLSDDGSRLSIGDAVVVDNDGLHGPRWGSGLVPLAAGWHPIVVEFFEKGGGEVLDVSWSGPGFARRHIAPEELRCRD